MVRAQGKHVEDLVKHFAVLSGDAHFGFECVGASTKCLHNRRQLDRFRARAKNNNGLDLSVVHEPQFRVGSNAVHVV